jgi:hypothetical protein
VRATKLQELEAMAAKLLTTARKLAAWSGASQHLQRDREISCANNFAARSRFAASAPRAEGEGEVMRNLLLGVSIGLFGVLAVLTARYIAAVLGAEGEEMKK